MSTSFFGRCDTCGKLVTSHYYSFNRQVEKCRYLQTEGAKNVEVVADVLLSDHLTQYCSDECAQVGAYCQLTDRGIPSHTTIGGGPIATCSKCAKPMDLTHLHVIYELMDQTEIQQPWHSSLEVHDATTVALVCASCDGDSIATADAQVVEEYEESATAALESRRLEFLK